MKGILHGAPTIVAVMTHQGEDYDVIRFGRRLRIVSQRTDRSLDAKGYFDLEAIEKEYPEAYLVLS
jgi:hypothetical protein